MGERVKHIMQKSCVLKKSTFSVMYVFEPTTTEIMHYYIWLFYNMCVQRACWVFPPLCFWNYVKTIAMTMLGAKPQEKVRHVSFTDLQKYLKAQILGSVVESNALLSILINSNSNPLTLRTWHPCPVK